MQILVLIGRVGASPHIGEILPLCDFFLLSWPFFSRERPQVEPLNRFSRFMAQTCFRAMKCYLGDRMMNDVIWGKYAPPKHPQNWREQAISSQNGKI